MDVPRSQRRRLLRAGLLGLAVTAAAASTASAQLVGKSYGWPSSSSVSADGRYVITSQRVGRELPYMKYILHDLQRGKTTTIASRATDALISADGKTLVYDDTTIQPHYYAHRLVIQPIGGRPIKSFSPYRLGGLDPTGRFAAVTREPRGGTFTVGILNLQTGKFTRFPESANRINSGTVQLSAGARTALYQTASGCCTGPWRRYSRLTGKSSSLKTPAYRAMGGGQGTMTADGSLVMVPWPGHGFAVVNASLKTVEVVPGGWAGSLSGDGDIVAFACGTRIGSNGSGTIYLYSRRTRLYRRLAKADGIAVALISASGNRVVWNTRRGIQIGRTADAVDVGSTVPAACT